MSVSNLVTVGTALASAVTTAGAAFALYKRKVKKLELDAVRNRIWDKLAHLDYLGALVGYDKLSAEQQLYLQELRKDARREYADRNLKELKAIFGKLIEIAMVLQHGIEI